MPRTYHDTQAGVNDQEQPRPSYYAVIPASVRYCKGLPPAAKLLFGEITALCSQEGFCWATNAYFCDLYEVDRRTLQRWLEALEREGFIRVEIPPGTGDRRIYDLTLRQIDPRQKLQGGAAKMRGGGGKNATRSITENITKSNTRTLNVVGDTFAEPSPLPLREAKKQEQEDKVSASPVVSELTPSAAWKAETIQEVVAVTGDEKSRKRFKQLLDVSEGAGAFSAWQDALDALKQRMRASAGPVERPGAYFCSLLIKSLNARGVAVPVGTPSARRSVRAMIVASMGSEAAE